MRQASSSRRIIARGWRRYTWADSERSLWEPHVETLGVFACYYLLCEGDNSGFNLNEDHV